MHSECLQLSAVPLSKKNTNFTPDTIRDPSGESCDITGNFWVTDLGKVVSIKYQNEQKLSTIICFV